MVGGVAALAGRFVLERLGDLRQREAGAVAQALDEPQPLEVRLVVQAVVALGARGGHEQPRLLVVAHRTGRQAHVGGGFLDARSQPRLRLARLDWRVVSVIVESSRNLAVYVKVQVRGRPPDRSRLLDQHFFAQQLQFATVSGVVGPDIPQPLTEETLALGPSATLPAGDPQISR